MASDVPSSSDTLPSDTVTPHNTADPASTLINVNVSNVSKLTGTNYITWCIQIQTLLEGYNLDNYLDSTSAPSATVIVNNTVTQNPAYPPWYRQDRLVFSALLGSISGPCQALVATSSTSAAAWRTLADTYGRSSRGHVKQIKEQMRRHTKGAKSMDEYMHFFKIKADELALLGKPMDHEDLVDIILGGLGDEYKSVKDAVHARDTTISFVELHERLLSHDVDLNVSAQSDFPISANTARTTSRPPWRARGGRHNSSNFTSRHPLSQHSAPSYRPSPRPYLGKCQLCGVQGHSARTCHMLHSLPSRPSDQYSASGNSSWQPTAHHASALQSQPSSPWLLDFGASHHVTSDLANLALHTPYQGGDEVVIGDGSGLAITHTGEGSKNGGNTSNRAS
ncbi:PREDICTED: uncharacterized protein LOC104801935 [Tarenaya hassleriana]|uniref:uncharacterized protein LOC104801935 n=1 Tax=Tarenaya hassleriana TaxID=28532 RepID=UPI00053C2EED|nr:PREDICTED: uncharacterized protein LOC104801935 [Tarenaya hassleriana]